MIRLLALIFAFTALTAVNVYAGYPIPETDSEWESLIGVFDLRDRESFIQVTNSDDDAVSVHVQIFNIAQNCGENNFFDAYTPHDTHVYNIRDIVTNDGTDAGFTLPDDAYGFVIVQFRDFTCGTPPCDSGDFNSEGIGNMRIKDASGYEYRTNLQALGTDNNDDGDDDDEHWFNFNQEEGVVFSDIFGTVVSNVAERSDDDDDDFVERWEDGAKLTPITESYVAFNAEILNLDEVLFSCGDLVFACTDGTDPLIPELLDDIGGEGDSDLGIISTVSMEFGINEAIPSSKDAPLVCPNNTTSAGTVFFNEEDHEGESPYAFIMFVGLNDGNGRGTFDSVWSGENLYDGEPMGD